MAQTSTLYNKLIIWFLVSSIALLASPTSPLVVTKLFSESDEDWEDLKGYEKLIKPLIVVLLLMTGGLITGLTLGLMALDKTNLLILRNSGTSQQKRWAEKVQPFLANEHLLLVTFLLTSTLVFESLPIVMEPMLGGGVAAVLVSTVLTLLFGEVIPQAICARHGLRIGAMFAWLVQILIWFMFIFAYPIATLLDWILGENHGLKYHRSELKELVAIHSSVNGGSLSTDEVTIIRGALDLSTKTATHIMTSSPHVFMLDTNCLLDHDTLQRVQNAGYTRIPIYKDTREHIIGVILTKYLILIDPNDCLPVTSIHLQPIPKVKDNTSLFDLLNSFQLGASHIAVVLDKDNKAQGIVTLEDVIEELIQEEIVDETDVYVDVPNRIRAVRAANADLRFSNYSLRPTLSITSARSYNGEPTRPGTAPSNDPKASLLDYIQEPIPNGSSKSHKRNLFSSPKPMAGYDTNDDNFYQSNYPAENSSRSRLRPGTEEDLVLQEQQEQRLPNYHSTSPQHSPDELTVGSI